LAISTPKVALLYSEETLNLRELLTPAKSLQFVPIAVFLGSNAKSLASEANLGCKCVVALDALFDSKIPETLAQAIAQISKLKGADLVLISGTKRGREVAARVAVKLNTGCATDVTNLRISSDKVLGDRIVWGGNGIATVSIRRTPLVFTVPPKAYHPLQEATSSTNIEEIALKVEPSRLSVVEKKPKPLQAGKSIKEADIVVSAGRGLKRKEDLKIIDEFANTIGAAVGGSRPLTSDLGWLPEERQVGLSGATVKPKLYIAVGISGQIQHLTGMRDSKVVVAINNDRNAPIFQECDYGIVGDLYQVIPELTKIMKQKLRK
jgi:electron transfer flavoprotein alpha subunit